MRTVHDPFAGLEPLVRARAVAEQRQPVVIGRHEAGQCLVRGHGTSLPSGRVWDDGPVRNRLPRYPLPDQTGRTWLVTGSTNGVGREVARAAAAAGARVLVTARDADRGRRVADEIGAARVIDLDLADQASVRAGAEQVDEELDVYVQCAGAVAKRRLTTPDGNELLMATNFLGPFAFTNLVADRLRDRVVVVGSNSHKSVTLDPDDLMPVRGWTIANGYARSKLADMLWALELGHRLQARGVDVNLAHPGWALSNMQNAFDREWANRATTALCSLIAQSSADAAHPMLMAATADIPAGSYVGPSRLGELRGAPQLAGRSPAASDADLARRLWARAVQLTGTDLAAQAVSPPHGG